MATKMTRRSGFFVVRGGAPMDLGASWPESATMAPSRRKSVVVDASGTATILDASLEDAIREAIDGVELGRKKGASVAHMVGRFGDAPLYEYAYELGDVPRSPASKATDPNREVKTVHFKIEKAAGTGRVIEGMASTSNVDRDNDIVDPKAFSDSLPDFMQNPMVLWNHCMNDVIGRVLEVEVRSEGLWVRIEIGTTDKANEVWTLIKSGMLHAFSVQFIVLEREIVDPSEEKDEGDDGGMDMGDDMGGYAEPMQRRITKAELLEVSVVSIPCNRQALFTLSKALKTGSGLMCRTCDQAADECECIGSKAIVEYRAGKVAGFGPVAMDAQSLLAHGGYELERNSRLIDKIGHSAMRHHGIQDGEVVLSPEAVRAAMAALIAYTDGGKGALDETERKAAYRHLARHYAEFGEEPPALPKGPAPEQMAKCLGTSSRGEWAVVATLADAAKWFAEHGFSQAPVPVTGGAQIGAAPNGRKAMESHALDSGVTALLYPRGVKGDSAMKTASKSGEPAAAPPAAPPATPAATPPPAAAQPATEPPQAAVDDGYIEIDAEELPVMQALERVNSLKPGQAADPDDLNLIRNSVEFEAD